MCKVSPYTSHRRRAAAGRPEGWLTISQLMERTGETRASIHHYSAMGLLPPPAKTARNMAYYEPECLERLALIRALQERSLSLSTIRDLFDRHGIGGVRRILAQTRDTDRLLRDLLAEPERSMVRETLLHASGLRSDELDVLEELRLAARAEDGSYDSVTVDLVMSVSRMRAAGLTEDRGFRVADLAFYRSVMEQVVEQEIGYFDARVLGRLSDREATALVEAALEHAEGIAIAVRRRVLVDFLRRAGADGASKRGAVGRRVSR